jgi:hypothetical protein
MFRMVRIAGKSIGLATAITLVAVRPAFAYFDPGTGGILFQALAAVFAVLTGVLLLFSRQIRAAFGRVRRSLRRTSDDKRQIPTRPPADHAHPQEKKEH